MTKACMHHKLPTSETFLLLKNEVGLRILIDATFTITRLNAAELTYFLTHSMEQGPSWEANQSLQLVKKFPAFLWNPKVRYRTQVPVTCLYPEPTPSNPHHLK
jgi:hypothetical protein